MQVVIEISEQDFSHVVNTGKTCDNSIYIAFKNAIILPAHGRLIDADNLKDTFVDTKIYNTEKGFFCYTGNEIKNAPTIIPATKGE